MLGQSSGGHVCYPVEQPIVSLVPNPLTLEYDALRMGLD